MKQTLLLAILFGVAFSASAQRINQTFTHLNGDKEIVNVADIAAVYPRGTGSTLALGPSLHTMDVTESQSNILSVSGGLIQSLTEVLSGYTVTQTRTVLIALQHVSTVTYIGNSQIGNVCRIQLRNPSMSINVRGTFAQIALILTKPITASFTGVITDATLTGGGTTGDTLGLAQQGAASGQVLKWDGTAWIPSNDSVGRGHIISSNGISGSYRDTLDFFDGSDIDFTLSTTSTKTFVTASVLPNSIDSTNIINGGVALSDISQGGASLNQLLSWNGSAWVPASVSGVTPDTVNIYTVNGDILAGVQRHVRLDSTAHFNIDYPNGVYGLHLFGGVDSASSNGYIEMSSPDFSRGVVISNFETRITAGNEGLRVILGIDNPQDGELLIGDGTNNMQFGRIILDTAQIVGGDTLVLSLAHDGQPASRIKLPSSGGGGGHIIMGAGTPVTQRDSLDFLNTGNVNFAVASTASKTTVVGSLAQQSATSGQVLKWDGSTWAPGTDNDGAATAGNLTAGSSKVTVTGGTGAVIGSGASVDVVQANLSLSSIGGSLNLSQIAQSSATTGQVPKWNGSAWVAAADSVGAVAQTANQIVYGTGTSITTSSVATIYPSGDPFLNGVMLLKPGFTSGKHALTIDSTDNDESAIFIRTRTESGKTMDDFMEVNAIGNQATSLRMIVENQSSSGSANAIVQVSAAAGDPYVSFRPGAGTDGYTMGLDNSASDVFVMGYGNLSTLVAPSGGAGLYMNTSSLVGIGAIPVTGRSLTVTGSMRLTSTAGTPTKVIGKDANGDVGDLTLATGLSISGGALTPADNSATNEIQTIDTFSISGNTLRLSLSSDGVGFSSVSLAPYLDNTDSQTLSIDSTTVGVKETFRLSISGGNTVAFDIGNDNIYNSSGSIAHDVSRNVSIMTNSSLNFLDSLTGVIASFDEAGVALMNGVSGFTTNSATFTTSGGQIALGSNLIIDMTGGYMSTTMSGGDQWGLYYSTGTAIIVDETQNLSLFSPNQNQAFTMDNTYSTWSFSSGADASIGLGTGGISLTADTITASPNSGGNIVLKINEPALSGSNYTGFTTAAMSSDRIYTLPTDTPSDGDVLGWHTGNLLSWDTPSGGGGVSDGDKGDITVSSSGSVWTIDNDVVTYAKMQNVSATARIMGRNTAGAGDMEELDASTVKTMLSLNNVENTALSTWAGSTNITTLGTISTGTVPISKVSSATLASTLTGTLGASVKFQIVYAGGNQGLTIDDGANSGSLFSKDGNQYFSADNTLLYLGAGGFNAETFAATTGVQTALQLVANTNTVNAVRTWATNSSGTAATGLGQRTLFQLESSTTNAQDAAAIDILWSDGTHASRTADIVFSTVASAGALAEAFRIGGTTYALTATAAVSNTNSAVDRLVIRTNSTGTAAANFGQTVSFYAETSTTDNTYQAGFGPSWTTATHASRTSGFGVYGVNSGTTQTLAWFQAASAPYLVINNGVTGTQYANAGITPNVSYTVGGSSNAVTISSSANSSGAITINTSGNNASGVTFGNTGFTSTSLAKKIIDITNSYTVASGTGTMTMLSLSSTYNLTSTASGVQIGIDLNPTLTSLTAATFRGINIPYSSSAAYGIYQSGSATNNIFVGKTTFGSTTTPTALVQIAAGTTTVAPLLLTSGTNLTSATAGAIEYDGTELYFSPSTTRQKLVRSLNGSATLDFPSTAAGAVSDLTITVTGAADGDPVFLGVPNASTVASGDFTAWVSAANTVTVRFANNDLITARDPASGTFKVTVQK